MCVHICTYTYIYMYILTQWAYTLPVYALIAPFHITWSFRDFLRINIDNSSLFFLMAARNSSILCDNLPEQPPIDGHVGYFQFMRLQYSNEYLCIWPGFCIFVQYNSGINYYWRKVYVHPLIFWYISMSPNYPRKGALPPVWTKRLCLPKPSHYTGLKKLWHYNRKKGIWLNVVL